MLMTLCAAALAFNAAADSMTWGYYNGTQNLGAWGTGKAESFSASMLVKEPSFAGSKVTAIRIPINSMPGELSNCAVFLSNEEPATSKGVATGDILNASFEPSSDVWNTIELAEPWTIDEDGTFYAGVTVTLDKIDNNSTNNPLLLMVGSTPDGLNIISSRTYRKWVDVSSSIGATLPLQLVIEGDVVKEIGASVTAISDVRVKHDEEAPVKVTIANHGTKAIESIEYTYEINGITLEGAAEANISGEFYGTTGQLTINTPAIAEVGEYTGTFTITKVNGVENVDLAASKTNTVKVMNIVPKKTPLVEEFTGCWCGFCPRGWLGLKLMNEWYPGEFVAASYHNGDAMQITTEYPVYVAGFPAGNIDRTYDLDAYYGFGSKPMGIEDAWLELCELETPVNVSVEAALSDDETTITANATFECCEDIASTNYGVAYIVTADGLKGEDKNWRQHSYYNGDASAADGYMDYFVYNDEYMFLEYDDVVIAESHNGGAFKEGVFGESATEGQLVNDSFDFALADMVSNYGNKENLVQNACKLNVIALLINAETGAVINCAKTRVTVPEGCSIESLSSDAREVARYSIDGTRQGSNAKGISIVRMSNGQAMKVIK